MYNIMKKKYPTATVVITGHSLGGAIAYIYILYTILIYMFI